MSRPLPFGGLYTLKEVAAMEGLSRDRVRQLCVDGRIRQSKMIGGVWFISAEYIFDDNDWSPNERKARGKNRRPYPKGVKRVWTKPYPKGVKRPLRTLNNAIRRAQKLAEKKAITAN